MTDDWWLKTRWSLSKEETFTFNLNIWNSKKEKKTVESSSWSSSCSKPWTVTSNGLQSQNRKSFQAEADTLCLILPGERCATNRPLVPCTKGRKLGKFLENQKPSETCANPHHLGERTERCRCIYCFVWLLVDFTPEIKISSSDLTCSISNAPTLSKLESSALKGYQFRWICDSSCIHWRQSCGRILAELWYHAIPLSRVSTADPRLSETVRKFVVAILYAECVRNMNVRCICYVSMYLFYSMHLECIIMYSRAVHKPVT